MTPAIAIGTLISVLLAVLVLTGAIWVVTLPNLFRAALSLGVVLLGISGLFIVLGAEFLAFVQILVYVGAILTLVVFAIMLTSKFHNQSVAASRPSLPAAIASLALFVLLVAATRPLLKQTDESLPAPVELAMLGQHLVTTLVLPFEVISLVFVAAIVGAVALASAKSSDNIVRSPGGVAKRGTC